MRVSFGGGEGLAATAPYRVRHAGGETHLAIDQSQKPTIGGLWFPRARFSFGSTAEVSLSNEDAQGWVIADAVQFIHLDDLNENKDGNPKRERGTSKSRKNAPESLANASGYEAAYIEDASTAIFRGAYTLFYYGFDKFKAPVRGDYKLRLKARPRVDETLPDCPSDKKQFFDMVRMMNDMSRLAFQTDSTRVITLFLSGVRTRESTLQMGPRSAAITTFLTMEKMRRN